MITLARAAPLTLVLLLAACGKPETITAGGPSDPTADQVKTAPPVKLPPAMLATKTYRCKDNSLVYIDWFNDSMTANVKTKKDGAVTHLLAPEAGKPYEGDGYSLTGAASDASVSFKKPGSTAQSCDA